MTVQEPVGFAKVDGFHISAEPFEVGASFEEPARAEGTRAVT
ncbi:MAG: hypothetical protein V3S54_09275 [Woeseiaceae bacterium]